MYVVSSDESLPKGLCEWVEGVVDNAAVYICIEHSLSSLSFPERF